MTKRTDEIMIYESCRLAGPDCGTGTGPDRIDL
jgi:hypothetical protein